MNSFYQRNNLELDFLVYIVNTLNKNNNVCMELVNNLINFSDIKQLEINEEDYLKYDLKYNVMF